MADTTTKGGTQNFDPQYGRAQGLNQSLANQFGYSGDFGAGGFQSFKESKTPQQQAAIEGYINNYNAQNSLMGQSLQALTDSANFMKKQAKFKPQQLSNINRDPYMNPYQQDVIDASMAEMNRQNLMGMNRLDDASQLAGAFGGDRHGIAMSEQARNFADQQNNWLANYNAANFDQATGQAQFDIGGQHQNKAANMQAGNNLANMANLGMGHAMGIQGLMGQAGSQQQQIMQQIMNAGQGGYNNMMGWGGQGGGIPGLPGSSTSQTSTPGIMDWLGLGLKAYGEFR